MVMQVQPKFHGQIIHKAKQCFCKSPFFVQNPPPASKEADFIPFSKSIFRNFELSIDNPKIIL